MSIESAALGQELIHGAAPLRIIGPLTIDRLEHGPRPGGAAAYAALVADAFGLHAQMLVSAGSDREPEGFDGHDVRYVPAVRTLEYEHRFDADGRRTMRLAAEPGIVLTPAHVPAAWPAPRTLVLTPLTPGDLDVPAFVRSSEAQEIAILAQGLQRQFDGPGVMTHLPRPAPALLESADERVSVFLSDEELRDWPVTDFDGLVRRSRRVVVTRGRDGADVHSARGVIHVPGRPASYVDPTGAGDVFATAFILAVRAGEQAAGEIAAAYAAAKIERRGLAPLPPLHNILMTLDGVSSPGAVGHGGPRGSG